MKPTEIRSLEEFKEAYYPMSYWKEVVQNWTPEELGYYLAMQISNEVNKRLSLPVETDPHLPPYPITDLLKEDVGSEYSAMA